MSYENERRSEDRRIGDLEQRMGEHSSRLAVLETQHSSLADREWVHELVKPFETAVTEMKHGIDNMKKFLEEESIRREKEVETRSFWYIIEKRWQPLLAIVGAFIAICASAGAALGWYLHMLGVLK